MEDKGAERALGFVTGRPFKVNFVRAKEREITRLKQEIGRMKSERTRLQKQGHLRDVETVERLIRRYETDLAKTRGWDPTSAPE